jgi:hypothetical protein
MGTPAGDATAAGMLLHCQASSTVLLAAAVTTAELGSCHTDRMAVLAVKSQMLQQHKTML